MDYPKDLVISKREKSILKQKKTPKSSLKKVSFRENNDPKILLNPAEGDDIINDVVEYRHKKGYT